MGNIERLIHLPRASNKKLQVNTPEVPGCFRGDPIADIDLQHGYM
jgi:hypothetical protein